MIAALFVETDGAYFGLPGVEPWDRRRDAMGYRGPWPVVAHPECQQWGRYARSHPILGSKYRTGGEDGGMFGFALSCARVFGGIVEHPAYSRAWESHALTAPPHTGGWIKADRFGGWTCHVEQGHYGHFSRKKTWLYAKGVQLPDLIWGEAEQRLPAYAVERYGYEKARRIGVMAAVGGKNKTRIRNGTPDRFRDLLIATAETANLFR